MALNDALFEYWNAMGMPVYHDGYNDFSFEEQWYWAMKVDADKPMGPMDETQYQDYMIDFTDLNKFTSMEQPCASVSGIINNDTIWKTQNCFTNLGFVCKLY